MTNGPFILPQPLRCRYCHPHTMNGARKAVRLARGAMTTAEWKGICGYCYRRRQSNPTFEFKSL
jgi:hypothetical protein